MSPLALYFVVATNPSITDDLSMDKAKVLKLAELERELGVSRWTLYDWLRTGRLHGFKLSCGHYRVPVNELERLKASGKGQGAE